MEFGIQQEVKGRSKKGKYEGHNKCEPGRALANVVCPSYKEQAGANGAPVLYMLRVRAQQLPISQRGL